MPMSHVEFDKRPCQAVDFLVVHSHRHLHRDDPDRVMEPMGCRLNPMLPKFMSCLQEEKLRCWLWGEKGGVGDSN